AKVANFLPPRARARGVVATLVGLAAARGWPCVPLRPGVVILGLEEAWTTSPPRRPRTTRHSRATTSSTSGRSTHEAARAGSAPAPWSALWAALAPGRRALLLRPRAPGRAAPRAGAHGRRRPAAVEEGGMQAGTAGAVMSQRTALTAA